MIVNTTPDGWEVIYHRAHGLLAAQIGGQWMAATRPDRWVEIVAAIAGHDDLAKEWESDNVNAAGAPADFRQNTGDGSLEPFEELIQTALYRGRWVALLTSMHACFLQAPSRDNDPEARKFLDAQSKQQTTWRRQLKVSKKQADQAYAFMQWCDRLSLILALRQIPTRERELEISTAPDGTRHTIMQRLDGSLNVTPWPFQDDQFMVRCEATYLKQLKFKDNAALVKALKTGTVKELCWRFSKKTLSTEVVATGELYTPATT